MSIRSLQKSFGGGEVTPEFFGRIDDAGYQTGLALARNVIVKPHGPVANRPGTKFVRAVKNSATKTRVIPFVFSTTNTFAIEIGVGYFRFHTNGASLLCTPAAYNAGTAYAIGDIVSSSSINYYCIQAGTGHTPASSATFWYAMTDPNVFEMPNPYAEADIFDIHYVQSNDVLTLTHPNYAPAELRRLGATQWTLTNIAFASALAAPGSILATANVTSVKNISAITKAAPAAVTTTAIHGLVTGNTVDMENIVGMVEMNGVVATVTVTGTKTFTLTGVDSTGFTAYTSGGTVSKTTGLGAVSSSYTVSSVGTDGIEESLTGTPNACVNDLLLDGNYNTITWTTTGATRYNVYKQSNGLYGFIGQTDGLTFKDVNITADISKTPPITNNPFSGGSNYPGAVSYYQQRRDFAGTINQPQNIWMTRTGTESNLSYSIPTHDNDSINFKIAAREANTIRHIVPMASMILLTSAAEYRITSVNSDAITPTSVSVTPQSYIGASNVVPAIVNYNLLFAAARGGHLREMAYSWQYSGYITGDLSLRAPHLFDGFDILDMAYAKGPYPIVWMVSSSGNLLSFTYVPEQKVGAYSHQDTYTLAGKSVFESVCVVPEGSEDAVYVVVKRKINGSYVRFIERFSSFLPNTKLNTCYFVDAGATFTDPLAITGMTAANPIVVTVSTHGYSNGDLIDLQDIIGNTQTAGFETLNGQRFTAAGVTTNTFQLTSIDDGSTIDGTALAAYVSGGTANKCVTTISSGLSHLEGETVSILGNGAVLPQQTVTGGAITFDPSSVLAIGLPVTADIELLPLAFETEAFGQGRMKDIDRAWLRVYNSSGIFAGPSFDNLTEAKQRSNEPYGQPPSLKSDEIELDVAPAWTSSGQLCVRQSDPLPLILTSITLEVEIGA